jgi:peroxisomal trans-2-enoyl-CoA reductase
MSVSLSQEWMEQNVRVNCVRPGIVWTDSGFANYGEAGEELSAKILPSIPAKRYASPQEISSAVVWLLCDGARYVTGQVIPVCGGSSYTSLPIHEIPVDRGCFLSPPYGELPARARL